MLLAPLLLALAPAPPDTLGVDPVHTCIGVVVSHAGFSQALGTASGTTGRVVLGENWRDAAVDVRIPLKSLDFGDAAWNRAVQNLLATDRFPDARFVSDRVTPHDGTHAEVCGAFTLHGITKPLCFDATLNAFKRHPMPPFRRTAGFSATLRLDRFDYGIDAWPSVIGRDVDVRIELEASRGIGAPDASVSSDEASR